jgi:hypothetical protein
VGPIPCSLFFSPAPDLLRGKAPQPAVATITRLAAAGRVPLSRKAEFVRRPAHTEAEDWIVYHPEITPTALMLYMRLRGAVMDPSSDASDWQKHSRFTVEQMRRLMPSARTTAKGGDLYAGKRTVQESLALLLRIGALRRTNDKGRVPIYDFPLYPPSAHVGPRWGGEVARRVREETKGRKPGRPAKVGGAEENPCGTPHGVRYTAPISENPCGTPHGGCGTPHGVKALTCDGRGSKKSFKKNPLPPQEEPLPVLAEEEEEETPSSPTERPAGEQHEHTDTALISIDWNGTPMPRGRDLRQMREAVSEALHAGWSVEGLVSAVKAQVNWKRADRPHRVVLYVLQECLRSPQEALTPLESTVENLKARIAAQRATVASCGVCNDMGRVDGVWHGHDEYGLTSRLWELENPEQAALNRAMNAGGS